MKHTFVRLMLIVLGVFVMPWLVYAQDNTIQPSATITPTASKKVEDLKERLATKVAELRQTQRSALFGTVKALSITTLTIATPTRDVKLELPDDVAIFQMIKGKRTTLTTDDIAVDDIVTIFGQLDTTINVLKPSIIFIQSPLPSKIHGKVTAVNTTAFTIELSSPTNETYTVDVEKATKTLTWNPTSGMTKSGFSKITIGDTIHITGTLAPKDTHRISADRIVDLGSIGAPTTPAVTDTPETSPSTSPKPSATTKPKATPTPSPLP